MKDKSLKIILISIAVGIWAIVLQNTGLIPTNQNVRVVNSIDAYVRGEVEVENTVDINISAINGNYNSFYDHNYNKVYDRIPVYTGN